jgi:cytochrome c oxidase assembly protein subunit 15
MGGRSGVGHGYHRRMRTDDPRTAPLRRLTMAAVVTNVLIVITGGAVRLTGSGLGCPEWPTCNAGSVVPVRSDEVAAWHQAIEFGNRLLSFVVVAVALAALIAILRRRPRRPDLVRPAVLLVVGILAQGVLGGITVLTGLNPLTVAAHFLLSMGLIAAAVTMHHRAGHPPGLRRPTIRPELRALERVLVTVVLGVLTLGTLVTATGPHAGDPNTPRLPLDPRLASQFHADGVFLLLGLVIALGFALRATDGPRRVRRAVATLLGVALAQGAIGYVQYFTGLPEVLVGFHLLGACLVWVATLDVWLSSTESVPRAAPRPPVAPVWESGVRGA